MIDKASIESIKSSIDLREIAAERLDSPKRQHDGRLLSKCPYSSHQDDTPSFYVGQAYYICFGCGKRGDVFSYYNDILHKDFLTAASELSQKLGITFGLEDEEAIKKWRKQTDDLQVKIEEQMDALWRNEEKLEYLRNRSLTDETIIKFNLGYDASKNSISIPFYDSSERPINIAYRNLGEGAKYFYEPTIKTFKGKEYFFNEHDLYNSGTVYIVEGLIDAITLSQYGKNAVAFHGNNISEQQIAKLRKYNPSKIVLCPDTKSDNDYVLGYKVAKLLKKSLDIPIKVVLPHEDINATPPEFIQVVLDNEFSVEIAFLNTAMVGDKEEQRIKIRKYISEIDDVLARDDVIEEVANQWGKSKQLVENYLNIKDSTVQIISIEEAINRLEEQTRRISLGNNIVHPDFNEFFTNVGAGHNMCLTARTGVGKTTMALNLMSCIAEPAHVLFFSLEQPSSEIMARLISIKSDMYGGLDGTPITTKYIKNMIRTNDASWEYIRKATEELCPNIHLYDNPCDIAQMENITRVAIDTYGPDVIVIVDYLGLIRMKGNISEYEKYSQHALDLQNMAKRLNVFVLFLHQLSRKGGSGQVAVSIDMLRGSGVIEEVSDLVMSIHYNVSDEDELGSIMKLPIRPVVISVLKNRHGPTYMFDNYVLDTRNLVFRRANDYAISGWDND